MWLYASTFIEKAPKKPPASTSLEEGLALETDGSEVVFATDDVLEGARAFLGKRAPRFTGR
jgi:enoyl-CoA hydratase/carnithine racemase